MNRHFLRLLLGGVIFLVFSPSDAEPQCYGFETVSNTNPPIKLKWPSSDIPVRFVVNYLGTPDVANSSYTDGEFMAINESFRTWSQVLSSYLVFQDDGIVSQSLASGKDSLNFVVWREAVWKERGYDETAIAITTTWYDYYGNIRNSDMELNGANFSWRVVGPASCIPEIDRNVVDVQNIVTHEIGHMLGLADITASVCNDVTMFYASSSCDTERRDLTQDDITGLSTLYPATLTLQSVFPSTAGNDAGVAITITGSGFIAGAQVWLTQDHRPDIQAGQVSVLSSALLTCAIPLTGTSIGKRTVVVTNVDGAQGKLFEGFTITTKGGTNFIPVAIAGSSNSIYVGSKAVLDGSKSYDPNGALLSYAWSVFSAPENISLTNPNTAYPSFVPGKSGNYVINLIVSNGQYESQPASVTIKVVANSSSDSGCGCVIQQGNRYGALSGGAILLCLYIIYEWLRRPRSLHSPRPGRNPR